MRRRSTGRLLTPKEIERLLEEAIARDGGCLVCGRRRLLDPHHILPQRTIKDAYLKRGGKRVGTLCSGSDVYPTYKPISRMEFIEPDITASQIARIPITVVALCRHHHERAEASHTYLLPSIHDQVELLGQMFALTPQLERYYGREFES